MSKGLFLKSYYRYFILIPNRIIDNLYDKDIDNIILYYIMQFFIVILSIILITNLIIEIIHSL